MIKGFTLIEIVIVLGIITMITGLSILGIVRYKAAVELNSAYTDLISSIKSQRNKANNSVSYNPDPNSPSFDTPSFYAIRFINNNYDLYVCQLFAPKSKSLTCLDELNAQPATFATGITLESNCPGIGFQSITTDLVKIDSNAFTSRGIFESKPNPAICSLTLKHNQTDSTKIININLVYDTLGF